MSLFLPAVISFGVAACVIACAKKGKKAKASRNNVTNPNNHVSASSTDNSATVPTTRELMDIYNNQANATGGARMPPSFDDAPPSYEEAVSSTKVS